MADINLQEIFQAEVVTAINRQRDGAAQDMRVVGAGIAAAIVQSDDPQAFGLINAGVKVPTTVPQPGVKQG